jgi:hypothetical protein
MTSNYRQAIAREAAIISEECTYSATAHFELASFYRLWHTVLGLIASGAGAFATSELATAEEVLPRTGVLAAAAIATIAAALLTFAKPSEKAQQHQATGARYNTIKAKARRLHSVDELSELDDKELRQRLEAIAQEKSEVEAISAGTSRLVYRLVRRRIRRGEATPDLAARSPGG